MVARLPPQRRSPAVRQPLTGRWHSRGGWAMPPADKRVQHAARRRRYYVSTSMPDEYDESSKGCRSVVATTHDGRDHCTGLDCTRHVAWAGQGRMHAIMHTHPSAGSGMSPPPLSLAAFAESCARESSRHVSTLRMISAVASGGTPSISRVPSVILLLYLQQQRPRSSSSQKTHMHCLSVALIVV
eukprot:COSAG06_NODE_9990_length_1747_cov_0.976716_3_plen_185_part_00